MLQLSYESKSAAEVFVTVFISPCDGALRMDQLCNRSAPPGKLQVGAFDHARMV